MAPITFTKLQAEEIAHKACIVRDEPDLQDSYELSEEQATAMADAFLAAHNGGDVDVRPDWVDCIVGEVENLIDIAKDNQEIDGPGSHLAYIKSMRSAIESVKRAA